MIIVGAAVLGGGILLAGGWFLWAWFRAGSP